MKTIKFILRYIKYYFSARTKYSIHSPFVFDLITKVLEDKHLYSDYNKVEAIRKKLIHNPNVIEVVDFGAGASSYPYSTRIKRVKDLAKKSAISPKYGQLLYRLIKYYQPDTMLELGTSLGISTMYQSIAAPKSKMICIEGCASTADKAQGNFDKLRLKNIKLNIGNFDNTLSPVLKKIDKLDYVYFDGNHRKEPTIRYFEQCLPLMHNDSILIVGDIYWSRGMEQAWDYIKKHNRVSITIDLFFLGIVFFKKELSKQNFIIKF